MAEEGYISQERAERATRGKVDVEPVNRRAGEPESRVLMEWLRKEYLYPEYGERLYTSGLKIHTTLDSRCRPQLKKRWHRSDREGGPSGRGGLDDPGRRGAGVVGGRDFRNVEKAAGSATRRIRGAEHGLFVQARGHCSPPSTMGSHRPRRSQGVPRTHIRWTCAV